MTKGHTRLLGASAAAACLFGASHAFAIGTTYGATYQGTISGVDTLGLFGARGASLNNVNYSEMFLINTLAGTKRTGTNQQDEWSESSSFITATLTVSGRTFTVHSSDYGEAFVNDGGNVNNNATGIDYSQGYGGANTYHAVYDFAAGSTSAAGYTGVLASYSNNPSASASGFPTGLDQAFSTAVGTGGTTGSGYLDLYYDDGCSIDEVETLTLRETVAAAPEPASWALMIFGVGALGAALRLARRRSVAVA